MQAGTFIQSTALLDGDFFEGATIFITEYNAAGAVGYMVNRPFERRLNELEEFKHSKPFPLYEGGPVDTQHLFFLHRSPDLIGNGALIANGVYLGGDFKQAVSLINNGAITQNDIKIFIGYCGWDAKELDNEIAEGSWKLVKDAEVFV